MHKPLKQQILAMYGARCAICGNTDPAVLTLDHINGNGSQERLSLGIRGVYHQALAHYQPAKYRVLCANCQLLAYREQCAAQARSPKSAQYRRYHHNWRQKFFNLYGSTCAVCGGSESLLAGHKLPGGRKEHTELGSNGVIAKAVKDFQPDIYFTICANCRLRRAA